MKILSLCFLSFVLGALTQQSLPCTFTDPSTGKVYDLTALSNPSSDYFIDVPSGTDVMTVTGYRVLINVCRSLLSQACYDLAGSQCDGCMEWPLDNPNPFQHKMAVGLLNATVFTPAQDVSGLNGEGVTLLLGGEAVTTTINFICDPSAEVGHPTYVSRPTTSSLVLQWKSKYGCSNGDPTTSKSAVFCDCASADISLCMDSACPKDTNVFCKTECMRFGGLGTSQKNSCTANVGEC